MGHLSRKKKLKRIFALLTKNLPFASCINKNKSYFFSNEIFLYSLINYKCLTILFKFNEKNDMFNKKKLNFYSRNKINLKRKVFRKKLNLYMFNRNKNKNFYLILLKFNLFKFIEFANFFFKNFNSK